MSFMRPVRLTHQHGIYTLVARAIPRFIEDLQRIERTGYGDAQCAIVKTALTSIREAAQERAGSRWIAQIALGGGDFCDAYERWNGNGASAERSAVANRRDELNELQKINKNWSAAFRRNHNGDVPSAPGDEEFAKLAYTALANVVASERAMFRSLASAVKEHGRNSRVKLRRKIR